jgi:hypothetical protein
MLTEMSTDTHTYFGGFPYTPVGFLKPVPDRICRGRDTPGTLISCFLP